MASLDVIIGHIGICQRASDDRYVWVWRAITSWDPFMNGTVVEHQPGSRMRNWQSGVLL